MANAYNYSNVSVPTTLAGNINAGTTTISVLATTGFPSVPFVVAIDYGASTEELMKVTSVAGLALTGTRGFGGTAAQSHSLGAVVRPVYNAQDATDFRSHEDSSAVHGASGAVVGTTNTQTLTNKTLAAPTVTGTAAFTGNVTVAGSTTLTGTLTPNGDVLGGVTIVGDTVGEPTLTVKRMSGQGADQLVVRDSDNSTILQVGNAGVKYATLRGKMIVSVPVGVDPADWQISGNTVAYINAGGEFDATSRSSTNSGNLLAAAGWTMNLWSSVLKNGHLTWTASLIRTGGTITASATGNIPETAVGTLMAAYRPHSLFSATPLMINAYGANGAADGVMTLNPSTGELALSTLSPTASIVNGNSVDFTWTYPVGSL